MTRIGGMDSVGTMTILNIANQDDPFYPDITVSSSIWDDPLQLRWGKIYVVAQCLGEEENEINCMANDYGGELVNWYGPYYAGSVEATTPSLRGVVIDDYGPGTYVKVIWVVSDGTYSEIRTDYFTYDFPTFGGFQQCSQNSPYNWILVDTYGISDGVLSCVAISVSNGEYHCLYNRADIDVVYYTWTES